MSESDASREPDLAQLSEQILDLIFRREFERAAEMIEAKLQSLSTDEAHRLTALRAILQEQSGDRQGGIQLMKQATEEAPGWLPHLYRLSVYFMDAERWSEANAAIDELISLSELKAEPYFLDEARFRKIMCLKKMGRNREIQFQKDRIPAGTAVFIGERLCRLEDLD